MNRISENIIPFIKQMLVELEGKVPEPLFFKIADIMIREIQYQELRNSSYGYSQGGLKGLEEKLSSLQQVSKGQEKLAKAFEVFAEKSEKDRCADNFQNIASFLYDLREDVIIGKGSLHALDQRQNGLEKKLEKLSLQSGGMDNLLSNLHRLNEEKFTFLDTNLLHVLDLLKKMTDGEPLSSFFKKIEERQTEEINKIEEQIKRLEGNLPEVQRVNEALKNLQAMSAEQDSQQRQENKKLEEQIKKIQEVIVSSRSDEPFSVLETRKIHEGIKKIQELLLLQDTKYDRPSGTQRTELLKNVQESLDKLPDSTKRINDYVENFRQSISLISKHVLELLQNTHEQSAHFTKLQTTLLQELNKTIDEKFQKMGNAAEGGTSGSIKKNLEDIMGALNVLKDISYQIRQQGQEHKKGSRHSAETDGHSPEKLADDIKEYVHQKIETSVIHLSSNLQKHLEKNRQEFRDEMSLVLQNSLAGLSKYMEGLIEAKMAILTHGIEEFGQSLIEQIRPLQNGLYELGKVINRVDLRLIARNEPGQEKKEKDNKVTAYCPHCNNEANAPISFQGKRVLCRHCRKEFTFPMID